MKMKQYWSIEKSTSVMLKLKNGKVKSEINGEKSNEW